jgi:AraC family transcriptional regulator of adaptative response/methylated-DNA-[protein]-cysteine methyltransferase
MSRDYDRIEKAILFLERNTQRQPSLSEVAKYTGLSDHHFQRLFRSFAGVSPKRFLQFLTAEYARGILQQSRTVLEAAFDAGLSGPGRLHDLMVNVHGMTPGEVKNFGAESTIRYGIHDSPFGKCLIAVTARGVSRLTFIQPKEFDRKFSDLTERWPGASFREDRKGTRPLIDRIFSRYRREDEYPITLHVAGTNLQIRVWEALLHIPPGTLIAYGDLAERAGFPGAARAVGTAVGQNPIAYLIPCHRVIRSTGAFGNYGGGPVRKKAILGWEAARFGSSKDFGP